jgi:hypothetical protein
LIRFFCAPSSIFVSLVALVVEKRPGTVSLLLVIQVESPSTLEAFTVPEISTPSSPITKASNLFLSSGLNNAPGT